MTVSYTHLDVYKRQPIGLLVGGTNFSELRWELEPARVVDGVEQAAVTINYGNFIQTMLCLLYTSRCV